RLKIPFASSAPLRDTSAPLKTHALRSVRERLLGAVRTIESARSAGEPNYITDGIYRDGQFFRFACTDLNERYPRRRIELVVAYDSSALPLAAPLAYFAGCGLGIIQPSGRGPILDLENITAGCRILLVADVLHRGTQLASAATLLRQSKGELIEIVTLLEIASAGGSKLLAPIPTYSICTLR
ncbi:MAG: phosphoribosyltransferase, partial [Verrucomicrobia bacterium]|nr:phosphoribosyltransferase [Verrucomicrobiota bacterium]